MQGGLDQAFIPDSYNFFVEEEVDLPNISYLRESNNKVDPLISIKQEN